MPALLAFDDLGLWLDLVGLGFVVLFVVLGLRGGLWWQLVRLLGLVATLAVGRAVGPHLGAGLTGLFSSLSPGVANGLGWSLAVLAGWLAVALVARLAKRVAEAPVELSFLDRSGGALAGVISGVVLHMTLLLCASHFARADWAPRIADSRSRAMLDVVDRGLPGLVEVHAARSLGLHER